MNASITEHSAEFPIDDDPWFVYPHRHVSEVQRLAEPFEMTPRGSKNFLSELGLIVIDLHFWFSTRRGRSQARRCGFPKAS